MSANHLTLKFHCTIFRKATIPRTEYRPFGLFGQNPARMYHSSHAPPPPPINSRYDKLHILGTSSCNFRVFCYFLPLTPLTFMHHHPEHSKTIFRSQTVYFSHDSHTPISVATRSKAWLCVLSLVGIAGSNLAKGMDACLL